MGGVGLSLYEHADYAGRNATLTRDTPDLRSLGMDNRVSSLRVAPREYWEVCDGRNYSGRCQVVSGAEPDLRAHEWNDIISSARRVRSSGGGARPPQPGRVGLELYAGANFSGRRIVLNSAWPDLRTMNFNDRAISLRVPGGEAWEVCANVNYDGCRVVYDDYTDLSEIGLRQGISSARPARRR
jgi:hypothetical protein